jgi:hypothetical protein
MPERRNQPEEPAFDLIRGLVVAGLGPEVSYLLGSLRYSSLSFVNGAY